MGKFTMTDAVVVINGGTLSDHISEVTLEDTAEEIDFTSFGSGYREIGQGLKDATITMTAFQDFAASKIHAVVQPLYAGGSVFPVTVKADDASVSPTNPLGSMTARVFSYNGIGGAVGDASTTPLTFRNASSSQGIVWSTA